MADAMKSNTPLTQAGFTTTRFDAERIVIREVGNATFVRVHAMSGTETVVAALQSRGFPASGVPNTSAGSGRFAMCLRPNEWLLFSEQADDGSMGAEVRTAFDPGTVAVLPQSDALACVRLSGAAAPWLLSKLSAVDYHALQGKGQYCTRTRLAQVTVLVHCHPSGEAGAQTGEHVYDLIFDRSIAAYLWNVLLRNAPHATELSKPL